MNQRRFMNFAVKYVLPAGIACAVFAQQPAQEGQGKKAAPKKGQRAQLLFRETWQQFPPGREHAVAHAGLANANLELMLYRTSGKDMQITGAAADEPIPTHVWTGLCE